MKNGLLKFVVTLFTAILITGCAANDDQNPPPEEPNLEEPENGELDNNGDIDGENVLEETEENLEEAEENLEEPFEDQDNDGVNENDPNTEE